MTAAEQFVRRVCETALCGEPPQGLSGTAYNHGARHALYDVARGMATDADEERRLRFIIDEQQVRVIGRGA